MRTACLASTVLLVATALVSAASAQQPRPVPPTAPPQPQAPQSAPPTPYKAMPITLARPANDPSLDAFRRELAEIAKRKDRNALAAKIVAKGFFWQREDTDTADQQKSGLDNLAAAVGLNARDGSGWEALGAYAADPTAEPVAEMQGVVCSPAAPAFNEKDLEQATQATKTDLTEWVYPMGPGLEVRAKPAANAPLADKLGLNLLRLYPDEEQNEATADWIRVVTPAGKTGYVLVSAVMPLVSDQLCYAKEGAGWKITGYAGAGAAEQ